MTDRSDQNEMPKADQKEMTDRSDQNDYMKEVVMSIMYAIVSALLLIVETGNLWYHKYKTERVVNKTDQKIKEIHTNFKKDYDTISDLIREVIYHNENLDGTNRDMKDELYRLYELLDKYKKELEEDKQPDIVNK